MQNNSYTVEKQSIDIEPYREPTAVPAQKKSQKKILSSGKNFNVETNSPSGIEFSSSQNEINFGELTATNPIVRQLDLILTSPTDFKILAIENFPLSKDKSIIPDTTCDSGSCTEITADLWLNTLTYGFGYHTASMAENEFMQFADISKKEQFETLFSGSGVKDMVNKVTYKVNVAGTQPKFSYRNVVTYLVVPTY